MSIDVVPIERLLHHEQIKIVERCKVFCVIEPVRIEWAVGTAG